jgi:hypothetical protein
MLDIDASSGTAIVTLRNLDGGGNPLASLSLRADGSIRISPAAGMKVFIDGDLEAERIRYLPASGLPKQNLN